MGNLLNKNSAAFNLRNADGTVATLDLASTAITNPFAIINGRDPQPIEEVKQLGPEAFRALTFRAVRPEDYAEIAERLPWVQQAGASFRWTGSWLSAFVTPDPKNTVVLEEAPRRELEAQMERFRQHAKNLFAKKFDTIVL